MSTVYLGLGANVGNRAANLRQALRLLTQMARIEAVSSLYETEPVGGPTGQPPFYNAACRLDTGLEPRALLRYLKNLEYEIGRRPGGPSWGPRPIDLDILLYEGLVLQEEGLTIPHPRLAERSFVLVPLAEIAPAVRHPSLNKPISQLRDEIKPSAIKLVTPQGWEGELNSSERLRL